MDSRATQALMILGLFGVLIGLYFFVLRGYVLPTNEISRAALEMTTTVDKNAAVPENCANNCMTIAGAVVPHHDLVAAQRAEFFADVSANMQTPKTIILLSPNHYNTGYGHVQTTDRVWNLGDGRVEADSNVVSSLVAGKLATNEPSSFINEHGIYNILGDIHNNFPSAKIVPIIFQNTSMAEINAVEQSLNKSCASCLMISSVDFSHYQPALLAQIHDDRSIRNLENLDTQDVYSGAEVDSGPSLAMLTLWARDHNADHFVLKNHTNSGIISGDPDIESTTHVFGWYETGEQTMPQPSVSFIVDGDMMFARMINHTFGKDFNNAFANFGDRVFWGTDAAIINLEGAITNKPIKDNIATNNMTFWFSPVIARTLNFLHINGVSQANNHSNNAGTEGVATTRSVLSAVNTQTFGGPTSDDITRTAVFHGQGLALTVVGVNMLTPGQTAEDLVSVIKDAKKDSPMRVLVMPHWGVEYKSGHTTAQAAAARLWIDAGADMVIGSHPHVIEDSELYKGVPIIYSLGNLLFDQTFSKQTQQGLLVAGTFTPDGLTFFALPTESIKNKPQLMRGPSKKNILTSLYIPFSDYVQATSAGDIIKINK